jgi:2-polyprenyl-6-methoxyphenol hydroxylase-like FAD-dependent oxidoreductase
MEPAGHWRAPGAEDRHVEVPLHLKPFSATGEKRLKHERHRGCASDEAIDAVLWLTWRADMSKVLGRQALVIGAGMSGLAAAGVLANHFEQVIVLERDRVGDQPGHRPGTPQCRQLHGLLAGGLEALGRIFPGLDRELAAAGAVPIRAADVREELPGFDPFPRRDFGRVLYAASRPLLERTVRRRALARRNIVIRDQCRALELVPAADRRSITGVRCQGIEGSRVTISADLVVDASARGTLTLAALDAMGRARPRETAVGVDIGYATMAFELPERRHDWGAVLTFPAAPGDRRSGFLLPVEESRWMVCIAELHCARPPRDLAEFLHAARRLRTRTIHDAIRNARPAGLPQRFGLADSSWRHYETVGDFPDGLVPIGDAICRFNPVYGQGMSVAAREASILADLLRRRAGAGVGLAGLPRAYLAEVRPWIAGAWSMSATPDLVYPQTRGVRPPDLERTLEFVSALYRVAARDPAVHELVVAVRHLARPNDALREPELVERVRAEMAAAAPATAGFASLAA